MLRLEGPSKTTQPTPRLRPDPLHPLCQEERAFFLPPSLRRTRALRAECDGEAGSAERELAVHRRQWEGELHGASSPGGAPPPRLDEVCAPAPPVHALCASECLGQVFTVLQEERALSCLRATAPGKRLPSLQLRPCWSIPLGRAGSYLQGWGPADSHPLLSTCAGLLCTAAPSSPLQLGT